MERKWNTDAYNGNTDSASDLEAPYDLYPLSGMESSSQSTRLSLGGEQHTHFNISNIIPRNNNENSFFTSPHFGENDYVNTAAIMEQSERKRPLISMTESHYVNVAALRDKGRNVEQDLLASVSTVPETEVPFNSSNCSTPSTSRLPTSGQEKDSRIHQLKSPNNNSNSTSGSSVERSTDTQNFPNSIVDVPTPCESKSSWQFYPEYGSVVHDMDSSEETPTPCSDASREIIGRQDSLDSFSGDGEFNEDSNDSKSIEHSEDNEEHDILKMLNGKTRNLVRENGHSRGDMNDNQLTRFGSDDLIKKIGNPTSGSALGTSQYLGSTSTDLEQNNLAMSPRDQGKELFPCSLNIHLKGVKVCSSFSSSDNLEMADSLSDMCSSSPEVIYPQNAAHPSQPDTAGISSSRLNSLLAVSSRNATKPYLGCDNPQWRGHVQYKPTAAERFISLEDCSEPDNFARREFVNFSGPPSSHSLLDSADRFCCWQRSTDPRNSAQRRVKRPLSLHGSEDARNFSIQRRSHSFTDTARNTSISPTCTCQSRETQTERFRYPFLRQGPSGNAMPRGGATPWSKGPNNLSKGLKSGHKVNLGVSSLRSAYPVVRRQLNVGFPSSNTTESLNKMVCGLESSQSTPNFVGLCHLNYSPKRHSQLESPASRETGWRYTRPVSDSGLFTKYARFISSKSKNFINPTPELVRDSSKQNQASTASAFLSTTNNVEVSRRTDLMNRRLSDPSYSLPQPPRRSESLCGNVSLARSMSEPHMKKPATESKREEVCAAPGSRITAASPVIYENLPNTVTQDADTIQLPSENTIVSLQEQVFSENSTVPKALKPVVNYLDDTSDDSTSESLNSESSLEEDAARAQQESLCFSESSDTGSDSDEDVDSGDNYAGSSEGSSDTISMDDLLTRLGVITTQDGDADDEDGFQDTTDDEDEDELLLPIAAPSRMCQRPPSPYPGLGESSDEDELLPTLGPPGTRPRTPRDTGDATQMRIRQPVPVRSQTDPDFLEFEIINIEDFGLEHPPSYTDLFPVGMPSLPEMPPSYDDAVRPVSVHQDHFDYASFQDHRVNNRLSLQVPWLSPGDDYLANPPPAYDEAVFNASARSHDELSYQSPESGSPVRRSRGRRILNGLRRFARKIFK